MRITALLALLGAPAALAAEILVTVGAGNSFAFSPTTITPAIGDTVVFEFLSRVHSATTTSFDTPCPPAIGGTLDGFDTGFIDATRAPANATVTITDLEPHWVACAQAAGAHCRMGMVMAINPPPDMTFEQFLANAVGS